VNGRKTLSGLLVALLALASAGSAQAGKRMPVRTQEIPDTESGRPAASAERPTFKGRLLIYGPQGLPVTPPPEHVKKPEPEATPVAAPAPKPEPAPAPVVTPVTPPPAPVAAPLPAPPVQAAKPEPVPQAPIAAPAPPPKPEPIAAPAPPAKPVAVAAPKPEPLAAPAPKPEPVVREEPRVREPVVRLEQARPAPAAAAPARQDVAMAAPSGAAAPSPASPVAIEMKMIESIFTCLAPGLPQDWKRAWVEITDAGGGKEKVSRFFFSNLRSDTDGEPLVPCNAQELTRRIVGLNDKLPPERRAWTRALLVIDSDGEYELSYEYPK
jgi:hypothetical protein